MSLSWTIDTKEELARIVGQDTVTLEEVEAFLTCAIGPQASRFRRLVDFSRAAPSM